MTIKDQMLDALAEHALYTEKLCIRCERLWFQPETKGDSDKCPLCNEEERRMTHAQTTYS